MGSLEDKSALLNQLKIDAEVKDNNEKGMKPVVIAALLSALISGTLVYWLFAQSADISTSRAVAPVADPVQTTKTLENRPATQQTPGSEYTANTQVSLSKSDSILNASGYITARRVATVSAEIMGLIDTVDVEEGMVVEKNQILATLDNAVAQVNLKLAQGQVAVLDAVLKGTTADLRETERELARITRLQNDKFTSEAELTRAQANQDKLRASLARAQADIHVAKLEVSRQGELLDNHTIRSPFAGVVTVKNAQPGEIVAPSSAGGGFTRTGICTIVDMNSLEIEVDVNEAFIGRVFAGQQVVANLDAYSDWDIPASVIAIIPTADRAKATVRVRIKIELTDPRILPDMGVKVAFLSL